MNTIQPPSKQGLYDPQHEHDACGVGFIVHQKGQKSHSIVADALTILENLEHRGACGCESNTGDGAGILMQIPHRFLQRVTAELGFALPAVGQYAVGMLYSSPDGLRRARSREVFEQVVARAGQKVLGWRDVPTDNSTLGETAQREKSSWRALRILRRGNFPSTCMAIDPVSGDRKSVV